MLGKKFTDEDVLREYTNCSRYENYELGLKPIYWVGDNDCEGMDTSNRPLPPLCYDKL
jgi:hypothetical protein